MLERRDKKRKQRESVALGSSDVELKGLKPAPDRCAPRTLPPRSVLRHQDVDARLAEPANTLSAGVRLAQERDPVASGAVDLRVAGRVSRRRVR